MGQAAIDGLAQEEQSWQAFRHALRREDQRALDRIFALARRNAGPLGQAGRMRPFEGIVLAALVELLKRIDDLDHRLAVAEQSASRPAPLEGLPLLP